jgi:hypothetical protein
MFRPAASGSGSGTVISDFAASTNRKRTAAISGRKVTGAE